MNTTRKRAAIFIISLVVSLSLAGLLLFGLSDFLDTSSGIYIDPNSTRIEGFEFSPSNTTLKDLSLRLGQFLWKTKAIDIIALGVMLVVASEATATIMKGIEEQCNEFKGLCEHDDFLLFSDKRFEEEESEEKSEET